MRASLTSFDTSEESGQEGAVTLAAISDEFKTSDGLARRTRLLLALGGGSAGFEAAVDGEIGVGWRAPIGDEHGPVGRFAIDGFVFGNSSSYSSALYLPKVELGYQWLDRDVLFEIGGHTGLIMAGRHNPADDVRKLGESFAFGGYAAFQLNWVQLTAIYTRMVRDDGPHAGLDTMRGVACGVVDAFSACADAAFLQGESTAPSGTSESASSLYGGLMLGYTFPER